MCIKIISLNESLPYDLNKPLEEQIRGAKQVVINYEPNDPSIEKFLDEVERVCQNGIGCQFGISVVHNNHLFGAKIKKKAAFLENGLNVNDLIKMMALEHSEIDRKLEALANFCTQRK